MPGQIVNVLQVPFHFSGSGHVRGRNASVSSTSSDLRTMDPQMKYLNPRPAPVPKARLPRLKTSPELAQNVEIFDQHTRNFTPMSASTESSGRSQTQGTGALSHLRLRIHGNKPQSHSPSTSPTRQGGFLATLRQLASRSGDGDVISEGSQHLTPSGSSYERNVWPPRTASTERWVTQTALSASRGSSRSHSPAHSLRHAASASSLAPRTALQPDNFADTHDGLPSTNFQTHRRDHSRSRDPSPLRNSLIIPRKETHSRQASATGLGLQAIPLDTLEEAPSQQCSPLDDDVHSTSNVTEPRRVEVDRNKRLPTLPNSPSSAYEQSPAKTIDDDHLQSHFSAMTISSYGNDSPIEGRNTDIFNFHGVLSDSTSTITRRPGYESVSFSESATALPSPSSSPYRLSSMPQTPTLGDRGSFPGLDVLPSESSSSTISTQASDLTSITSVDGSDGARDDQESFEQTGDQFKPAQLFQYRLPTATGMQDPDSKHDNFLPNVIDQEGQALDESVMVRRHDSIMQHPRPAFEHSTSMQRLMDELSYLGNMINT